MTLDLDELRSFLTLASELHFRKAAERLFVSQPALSKQIQKLEEKTGGALFERTRRKVALREAGRVLIPLAERLLRDSQAALDRVRQASEGRAGTLRPRVRAGGLPPPNARALATVPDTLRLARRRAAHEGPPANDPAVSQGLSGNCNTDARYVHPGANQSIAGGTDRHWDHPFAGGSPRTFQLAAHPRAAGCGRSPCNTVPRQRWPGLLARQALPAHRPGRINDLL